MTTPEPDATSVTPFLMFQGGRAEEALTFYVSLFQEARVDSIDRYGPDGQGPEGSVALAAFTLAGQRLLCIDSPVEHGFDFTPSTSLFVECKDDAEVDRLFAALAEGGEVLMPLDAYPFSSRYGWVNDRFGVSWQLSRGTRSVPGSEGGP